MDGDLQHDERLLLPMLALLRGDSADLVVASPLCRWRLRPPQLSSQRAFRQPLGDRARPPPAEARAQRPDERFSSCCPASRSRASRPRLSTQGFKILLDNRGHRRRAACGSPSSPFEFPPAAVRREQARCRRRARICRPAVRQSDRRTGSRCGSCCSAWSARSASGVHFVALIVGYDLLGLQFVWAQKRSP